MSTAATGVFVRDNITSTCRICLKAGGFVKLGIATEPAPGVNPDSMKGTIYISPGFQRDTLIMNMLDVLCFQKDHRPNNYFCVLDGLGRVSGLFVFDNDCPSTFFPSPSIRFQSYVKCSPFVTREGYINRPFLDKATAGCFMGLCEEQLNEALSGKYGSTYLKYFAGKYDAEIAC